MNHFLISLGICMILQGLRELYIRKNYEPKYPNSWKCEQPKCTFEVSGTDMQRVLQVRDRHLHDHL